MDSVSELDDSFRQNESADQNGIADYASHIGFEHDFDTYGLSNTDKHYIVETGALKIIVNKNGEYLVDTVTKGNKTFFKKAKPVLKLEETNETNESLTKTVRKYVGKINKIFLEETGPVQTTFKFEGVHVCCDLEHEGEEKFPFVIRMFIEGTGGGRIRFQHTFLYVETRVNSKERCNGFCFIQTKKRRNTDSVASLPGCFGFKRRNGNCLVLMGCN